MVARLTSDEVDAIMYLVGKGATSPEESIDLSTIPDRFKDIINKLISLGIVERVGDSVYIDQGKLDKAYLRTVFKQYRKTIFLRLSVATLLVFVLCFLLLSYILEVGLYLGLILSLIASLALFFLGIVKLYVTFYR